MSDKDGNNTLTWVLPEVVNPPDSLCVVVPVPNDRHHIMAFKGAIFDLSYWWNWERDDAHTAAAVARVWRKIFYGLQFDVCNIVPVQPAQIRIDPMDGLVQVIRTGGECLFQYRCCVDDPWITLAPQASVPGASQPGSGGTPAPGGTRQTCAKLNAYGQLLLPTLVSSGDTITLDSCAGAGYDGVEFDFGPLWREMNNGDQFVGGLDVGFPVTGVSGDPVTAAPHMSIVAAIGATPTYVALPVGVPVAVPGGISNAQVFIQVNDSTLSNNQGSADVCVTVKNNAVGTFTHVFDLTVSPGGPHVIDTGTDPWAVGLGWQTFNYNTSSTNQVRSFALDITAPHSYSLLASKFEFTITAGTVGAAGTSAIVLYDGVAQYTSFLPALPTSPIDLTTPTTVTTIHISMACGNDTIGTDPGGQVTLFRITITGTGADPFA